MESHLSDLKRNVLRARLPENSVIISENICLKFTLGLQIFYPLGVMLVLYPLN